MKNLTSRVDDLVSARAVAQRVRELLELALLLLLGAQFLLGRVYKCRGAETYVRLSVNTPGPGLGPDEAQLKIRSQFYGATFSLGDDAVLLMPMAGGVFDARCICSIVGMN